MHSATNEDDDVRREATPMSLLQGSSNFNIHNSSINQIHGNANLNHIHANITVIRLADHQFTHDQRCWISDYISTHVTLPDINNNQNVNFLTQSIINMPRAEAVFNDYQNKKNNGPCFEGTRLALLREMADWVTDIDASSIYVLSGLAGIGKSTVAYTIASRAAELNLLGASFFFSRDDSDRNNAKKFFTTIAYQLCVYDEAFAKSIGQALQTDRGSAATTKDPQEQLQALILNPLRNIVRPRTRPILVVVDALDECDDDDDYTVIMGLSQLVRDLPPFKVILTTRPKPYISYFQEGQDDHKLFHLQDIEDKVVDSDIRLYLQHSLSQEQVRKRFLKRKWFASDEEIECLVRAAGRLFIIASTAVRYILDKFASNPAGQMRNLLCAFAEDRTPFKDLDHFYTVILRNVVPVDCDNDGTVCRYQWVVGAIIFVQQPLPISTLACIIDMDEDDIYAVLDHLQSVILLDNDNVPRIYHKSFPDYLTDQTRCKDTHLRIDPKIHHMQIASRCFEIANKHLRYNILGLSKTARYMSNEDGLKEDGITDDQLQEKIPQQVRYACVYWPDHLQVSSSRMENMDVMNGLSKFVYEHTLHWIEVLSLTGNLDSAHRARGVVLTLLDSMPSDLQQLLSDVFRFISKFYEIIQQSALHTYYSALPFSPTGSLLYRQFIKKAEHNVFVIEGGPEKWDAIVTSLSHSHEIDLDFIQFSPNGAVFLSCSEEYGKCLEGKLKIWEAATGTPICTIPGQRFAVSNDFSVIASSTGDTIKYYNKNGTERGGMSKTSSKVDKLALSDSGRIAAVLSDGTVSLWEIKNAESIHIFDEFRSSKYFDQFQGSKHRVRLQFSSTDIRLAYSSWESSIIKLRDGMTGQFIADLLCGSEHEFAFSGDGSRIASQSLSKHGLKLWSCESGALISGVKNLGSDLAISENGSLLATMYRGDVKLWSENRGCLVVVKLLPSVYAFSMAFSLDNILAIGAMEDIKFYNAKTHFISTIPKKRFAGVLLAFSPDRTRFVYGGQGNMYLLDIQGIGTSSPSSKKAASVYDITLPQDCSRLACVYEEDRRLELWATSPAMQLITSHKSSALFSTAFGPDGGLFASVSSPGTINLWNGGDGSLHGTVQAHTKLEAMALSNSLLVAAGEDNVTLWNLDTLNPIHAFKKSAKCTVYTISISDASDLVAIGYEKSIGLFDVVNGTIATIPFEVSSRYRLYRTIHKLIFLPDKSRLVAHLVTGDFRTINLINQCISEEPISKYQLPDTMLWHGVPTLHSVVKRQHCFSALFSQHKEPVPVLWIPGDIPPSAWGMGSSMVALGCKDGRILLLRLCTDDKEDRISPDVQSPSHIDTKHKGTSSNAQSAGNALVAPINKQHEVPGSQLQ